MAQSQELNRRHVARGGLVALGALLAACSSLLGIEDLHEEPRDGANAGGGQAGTTMGASGKSGNTGSGGAAGASAQGGAAGKGGGGGAAGAAAQAGAPTSGGSAGANAGGNGGSVAGNAGTAGTVGNAGEGGSGTPQTGPVTGTIIDFWHHTLAGVPVRIGDATATTDADGKFTIPDVDETYDAAFVITTDDPLTLHEWVFQGLTRRDPTLQVTKGLADREAIFYVTQTMGGTFNEGRWYLAFGSDNGTRASSANSAGFDVRPYWQGPSTNQWTLHSLFLERTGELPTSYLAYEAKTATTNDGSNQMQQDYSFDLSEQDIDTGNINGSVTDTDPASDEGRTNSVFVRFTTGAALPVVDEATVSGSAYDYLVPDLSNGSITVAAAETHADGSYAIAHRDNRSLGDMGITVEIPPPPSALLPLDETTNVDNDTKLSFSAGDPENAGYLIQIESQYFNQGVFIVTTKRELTLGEIPIVNDMNLIVANTWHNWDVQTHGKYASVDEMTGPNGFLDPFALNNTLPQGPPRVDGAYTESILTDFQTAP